jgi:hypothetical protein
LLSPTVIRVWNYLLRRFPGRARADVPFSLLSLPVPLFAKRAYISLNLVVFVLSDFSNGLPLLTRVRVALRAHYLRMMIIMVPIELLVEVICLEVLRLMPDSRESEGRTVEPRTQRVKVGLGRALGVLAGLKSA